MLSAKQLPSTAILSLRLIRVLSGSMATGVCSLIILSLLSQLQDKFSYICVEFYMHMIKRLLTSALLLCCTLSQAQSIFDFFMPSEPPHAKASAKEVKFEYDVDFQYYFDNREFTVSDNTYDFSGTFNSAVLTPSAGLSIMQGRRVQHRLMAGIDVWRNMGESVVAGNFPGESNPSVVNLDLFHEIILYYDVHAVLKDGGRFEGVAGVFPRTFSEGEYSQAFYSDETRFWDRNLDGVILKYRNRDFYAEAGCDWMGMKGVARKERFEVFTAGRWSALDWLSIGWAGSFYHYAGSELAPGVVDNHMVNPYVKADFGKASGLQELSFKLGFLGTYQRDRLIDNDPCLKGGGHFDFVLRNWNLGLRNMAYAGGNLAPYYYAHDSAGNMYGKDLYRGNPFYKRGLYDRAECFWEPKISDFVSLKLAAVFHFADKGDAPGVYQGCQQMLSLVFDLDAFRNPSCCSGKVGQPRGRERRIENIGDVLPL